ncbi:hypothetical protein [Oryzobacter telluris]|uniref:hypothetical protein n=1 Tax=Oryzobacter telluris TaxID=3149179 RepID=UPI00370DB5A2
MRPDRHRAVLAVLVTLALLGWAAPTASAGGPTSVLLVNVTDGRTASAHVSQPRYDQVWRAFDQGLGPVVTEGTPSAEANAEVRATWLIHDVTPWRLDSVYRVGSDLWVLTQTDESGTGTLWDAPERWHHLTGTDATALDDLLGGLGIVGAATSAGSAGPVATSPRVVSPVPASDEGLLADWRLALVAALVGVGLGLLAGRIGAARARRDLDGRLDPLPQ